MKLFFTCFWVFCFSLTSIAQLLPGIGVINRPPDNAAICTEPFYLGNFYTTGFQQGDTVPDFKLYGLNGDSLVLSKALSIGKPTLLIAGSLTCPVFRQKVATINQVVATYSNHITIYVIYTLEAHPTDTSIYFGYVNVTSQNISAGILFAQPKTYGQRKKMIDTLPNFLILNAPVFIDGPCNTWWKKFGPAPNNSYLIGTNGVVLNKQGWFHKSPDNIFCDLDSILNTTSGLCSGPPLAPGNFSVNTLNTSVLGNPGDLLYDYADLVNTSTVSTIIKIKKLQKNLPVGWQTAFCADVCYGVTDDSVEVMIDPLDTIHFSLDFFTTTTADSGNVRVGFKNVNKSNNAFSFWLKASTLQNLVGLTAIPETIVNLNIYPNPASQTVKVISPFENSVLTIYDPRGKLIWESDKPANLNVSDWENGLYFILDRSASGIRSGKLIVDK